MAANQGEKDREPGLADRPKSLKQTITVDNVGRDVFRCTSMWITEEMRTAYGGQLAAQALNAAVQTVADQAFLVNSIHCHFVGTTVQTIDLFYHVERVKDGTSFCSRYVKAIQGDKTVFQCMVSFYKAGEATAGLDHVTHAMPDIPRPDISMPSSSEYELLDVTKYLRAFLFFQLYTYENKESLRKFTAQEANEPKMTHWLKTFPEALSASDSENFHRTALLYASDMALGVTIHRKYPTLRDTSLYTSLDHTVWFHAAVRADQWHLMVAECEHAAGERTLNVCRIYSGDGTLVATCQQEFFIRPKL